jgi:hypothetical protein
MKKQINLNSKLAGKSELLKEVDRRFKKEVEKIEKELKAAPDRGNYIKSELNFINYILHKEIYPHDLLKTVFGTYYKTVPYSLKQIDSIRRNYRLYLKGIINVPPEAVIMTKVEDIINAILFYQLEGYLKNLNAKKAVYPEKVYNSLDELFINTEDIEPCIKALSDVDPPIINEKGRYIGNRKGAFVIWIDVLNRKNKLHKIEDKFLPELLEKKFPGLKISAPLFRQQNFRAEAEYFQNFIALIPK